MGCGEVARLVGVARARHMSVLCGHNRYLRLGACKVKRFIRLTIMVLGDHAAWSYVLARALAAL